MRRRTVLTVGSLLMRPADALNVTGQLAVASPQRL